MTNSYEILSIFPLKALIDLARVRCITSECLLFPHSRGHWNYLRWFQGTVCTL